MCSVCYLEAHRSNTCVEDERGEGKELTCPLRCAYHAWNPCEFFVAVLRGTCIENAADMISALEDSWEHL